MLPSTTSQAGGSADEGHDAHLQRSVHRTEPARPGIHARLGLRMGRGDGQPRNPLAGRPIPACIGCPDRADQERQVQLANGPYADTREQIGGYNIIDCADLDQAIEVATKHPIARFGAVEVRPFSPQ